LLQQLHVVAINKTKTKYTSTNKARTNEYDCNLSQRKQTWTIATISKAN